jgi:glycosyltransferase involved in cell wall biosynthesis
MNITIIDHVGKKAGMDYYTSSLGKGLINNNCKVVICSNFEGMLNKKIEYKNYYEDHSKVSKILKIFRFLTAIVKSSFYAYKQKSDLVILHLFSSSLDTLLLVLIPKIFGLKVAVISHDISSFANNDKKLIQNAIYNYLSDDIIVHNEFSKKKLIESIELKQKDKLFVIKHGGYLDHINNTLSKHEARKKLNFAQDGKYLLFFGQIKNVKGLDILMKSMANISKDITLVIAGKPWKSDFSTYEEIITTYGLENRIVKLIRFIEDEERELLFLASDVNILPYRVIYQSGVLLMAMSHGLPVIASDLDANKEIINDGENGLLFESENIISLSNKINKFFDEDLKNKLSINSIKTIKDEYGWNEIAKNYIKLINNQYEE